MTYDTNSFCAFNKRNGDKNTITYPFANGERVIIQRTYSNNGTSVFSEIRIDENGEKTVSVLNRAEMNDELFDRTREMLVEMHHKDENKDIRFLKHTLNIDEVTDDALIVPSVEDDYIDELRKLEEENSPLAETMKNAITILNSCLTETQKRRYIRTKFYGKTTREVAAEEGVSQRTIQDSIELSEEKIKIFLENAKIDLSKRPKKAVK